jgi:hypothetical protein
VRSVRAGLLALGAPLALVGTLVSVGCGSPGAAGPVSAAGGPATFADQVAAVRRGDASRLVIDRPPTDAEWESLRGLAGLREIVLAAGGVDDSRAGMLATLPDIERLVLRDSPLTDKGFRTLAGCLSLRDLNVPQAACTAAGIRALAALPRLQSLRLGGPYLAGAEVCEAVVAIEPLKSLHLIDVPIGDDGIRVLAGRPDLRNLYLDGAGVSDDGWAGYFRACPEVHVHVDQAHHDRDPRRHHE